MLKQPIAAGRFYPGEPETLCRTVRTLLEGSPTAAGAPAPKALIVPHAGYVYSGTVAGAAFARLRPDARSIRRVLLLGPAHFVPFGGLAVPEAEELSTPLGAVPIDRALREKVLSFRQVRRSDEPYIPEHSLEVELPFLQEVLPTCRLLPLLVGEADPQEVGEVLEAAWGGPETRVVVSSDLSHYHDAGTARRLDGETAGWIEGMRSPIPADRACGAAPISGLLWLARRRRMRVETLLLLHSGDTGGPADRVVGYGAFLFFEPRPGSRFTPAGVFHGLPRRAPRRPNPACPSRRGTAAATPKSPPGAIRPGR